MSTFKHSCLAAALAVFALPAFAIDDGTQEAEPAQPGDNESVTYSGAGLTRVSTDFKNLKDAVNLTGVIGFRIPTVPYFSAELEISTTIIPGENSGPPPCSGGGGGGGGGGGLLGGLLGGGGEPDSGGVVCEGGRFSTSRNELQTNNIAIYAVARSPGKYYAMGKVGYRYANTSIEELQVERSGSAYGAGIGYRWNPAGLSGVELAYTKFTDEIDYVGFNLSYGFSGRD